jgi:hypothetical protein
MRQIRDLSVANLLILRLFSPLSSTCTDRSLLMADVTWVPAMVVVTLADLHRLRSGGSASLRRRKLRLALPELSPSESQSWELQLNREAGECGCKTGGLFLVLTALALLIVVLHQPSLLLNTPVRSAALGAAALVASGVLGKMIGLVLARARFRRAITDLSRVTTPAVRGRSVPAEAAAPSGSRTPEL